MAVARVQGDGGGRGSCLPEIVAAVASQTTSISIQRCSMAAGRGSLGGVDGLSCYCGMAACNTDGRAVRVRLGNAQTLILRPSRGVGRAGRAAGVRARASIIELMGWPHSMG